MKHILFLLGIASILLATAGCTQDLDFDKVTGDVCVKPSLMIPLANADVTAGYLFEEVDGNVKHVLDDSGDKRIVIYSDRDSIVKYGVFDLFNINFDESSISQDIPLYGFNTLIDNASPSLPSVERSFSFDIELPTKNINLKSVNINYQINISYEDFDMPVDISWSLADAEFETETASGTSLIYKNYKRVDVDVVNNKMKFTLKLSADLATKAHLGKLQVSLNIDSVNSITGAVDNFGFTTEKVIQRTNLPAFKRTDGHIRFANPWFRLSSVNGIPLQISVVPYVYSLHGKAEKLANIPINLPAANNGQPVSHKDILDKDNSKVVDFFHVLPDSVEYYAAVSMTMPEGVETITLSPQDSICLGYGYEIPVEFTADTDLESDTIDISDISNLEDILRAKLYVNVSNELPISATINIAFCNSMTGRTLTKIVVDDIIAQPNIDASGKSTNMIKKERVVEFTPNDVEALRKSDQMIVSISMKTPDDGTVSVIVTKNRLKFSMALAAEFDLNN